MQTRDIILTAIKNTKETFTAREISEKTKKNTDVVKYYIRQFIKEGIIELVEYTNGIKKYKLKGSGIYEMIWKTARILKNFTIDDLRLAIYDLADIKDWQIEEYLNYLIQGKYIRKNKDSYTFNVNRYHGPKAPEVRRVIQIYDPNTKEVTGEVIYG